MVQFFATNRDGEQSMTVFGSDWQKPVAGTHPNFGTLLEYLLRTPENEHDEDYVRGLVDPTVGIGRTLREHFGDRVSFDLHHLYLDGRKVDGPLASTIKTRMLAADQDWLRFAKFLVNLERNPSYTAQQFLWQWVEEQGLTITEDGRILGYKGVDNDGLSMHSGPNNYINGVLYLDGEDTRVPHEIGTVISKRRADVDDSAQACSTGLHVGSKDYATGFGPRLMTVAFDPADVVGGNRGWKIRVCKYEVISLADPVQFAGTSYDLGVAEPVEPSDERQAVESDLEHLDAEERVVYDAARKGGLSHAEGLDAVLDTPYGTDQPEVDEVAVESVGTDLADLVEPTQGTGLLGRVVLRDWAAVNPGLARDLADSSQGHKAVARKYADITTEASVRRYRKSIA